MILKLNKKIFHVPAFRIIVNLGGGISFCSLSKGYLISYLKHMKYERRRIYLQVLDFMIRKIITAKTSMTVSIIMS